MQSRGWQRLLHFVPSRLRYYAGHRTHPPAGHRLRARAIGLSGCHAVSARAGLSGRRSRVSCPQPGWVSLHRRIRPVGRCGFDCSKGLLFVRTSAFPIRRISNAEASREDSRNTATGIGRRGSRRMAAAGTLPAASNDRFRLSYHHGGRAQHAERCAR